MSERFRISAKKLGALAMPEFCPRCFWIRSHMEGEAPFAVFPRIFNDIDGYTKRVVNGWCATRNEWPTWLAGLGTITGSIPPPKSAKFQIAIGESTTLTGEADAIFTMADGTLCIVDFKTAFHRGVDDPLYPTYVVQLNAYGLLAEQLGMGTVSKLALVYTEPMTSDTSARNKENQRDDGFALGFRAEILEVPRDNQIVLAWAAAALKVHSNTTAPQGRQGCVDCANLEMLIATTKLVVFDYKKI